MDSGWIGKTLLGRYRIDQFLGRGGMAEVYKVWDTHRGVHLAMKLLHEDLAQDVVFLRRFRREANTLSKFQHPNIIRFYGLEQDEFLAFILTDYVDGESLKREIFRYRGKGIPFRRVVEIIKPVCSVLGYAHRQGLIHCDLKPGNIMIDQSGTVFLADFGIARMTDSATATMVGAGTPAYMAPEQVKGLDPIPQTDIYALGVTLFEMLTGGERPFTGEATTTTGSTSAKVRWEQVNLVPPSPREYNLEISTELESVVLKCLAKCPADRYQTPLDVLNSLERAVGGVERREKEADKHIIFLEPELISAPETVNVQPSNVQPETGPTINWFQRWGGWIGVGGLLAAAMAIFFTGVGITPPIPEPTETLLSIETKALVPSPKATSTPTDTPLPPPTATPEFGIGSTRVSPVDGMVQVYIPAGEFLMGSEEGDFYVSPVHTVYLDAFWLDQHEVTYSQFQLFLENENYRVSLFSQCEYRADHPNHPVACINIEDAQDYCDWAGRRLPTEPEWEKAARGGLEGKKYPWGDEDPICQTGADNGAQYSHCSGRAITVKTFAPNGYGLYDMSGNVWEWVTGFLPDPTGPVSRSYHDEVRGGSWSDYGYFVQVVSSNRNNAYDRPGNYGFRCASTSP